MVRKNRGRWFALAAGLSVGVWFGAVLADSRNAQAGVMNDLPAMVGESHHFE